MSVEIVLLGVTALAVVSIVVMGVVVVRWRRAESAGAVDTDSLVEEFKRSVAHRDGTLDAQVVELNHKLANLQESVTGREAALDQQVQGLGVQMQAITGLFTNDRARGGWGEISLLNIFERAGLTEGRDYTAQFNAGDRIPDAVVHLPGERNIVVDAKFPVSRYNEALATDDAGERDALLAEQGRELERVGKALVGKGYADIASGGYVVMYLPSQAVYESAAAAHGHVIEHLMRMRIVVAGPTSLFMLIMHAGSLLTEHRSIRQSDEVLGAARELRGRMATFVDHLHSLQASLSKTVLSFNQAVGSWTSRVSPQLERMNELSGQHGIDSPEPIDESVREISSRSHASSSASLN